MFFCDLKVVVLGIYFKNNNKIAWRTEWRSIGSRCHPQSGSFSHLICVTNPGSSWWKHGNAVPVMLVLLRTESRVLCCQLKIAAASYENVGRTGTVFHKSYSQSISFLLMRAWSRSCKHSYLNSSNVRLLLDCFTWTPFAILLTLVLTLIYELCW